MTQNVSENKIITEVLSGNTRAFASIMERYAPKVYAMVAGMIGNNDDAADLTQEIFTKIYTSLSSYKGDSSLSTWIFRISYNMAVSRMRKSARFDTVSGDDRFWSGLADTAADSFDEPEGDISVDSLYKALDFLAPDDRVLISLFYLDGKTITEISQIMSLSETNAKTRLFRIRKKLFKIISNEYKQQ